MIVRPPAVKLATGNVTANPGKVTEGRARLVMPVTMLETEIVVPGRVTTGVLSGLVTIGALAVPVAVAMTTSGSWTAVAGARVMVAAGMTTLTPRVEMVKAGAVNVRPAEAVKVASGAVYVPAVVTSSNGIERVCAGAVITWPVGAVSVRPLRVKVARGRVMEKAGNVTAGSGMLVG